MYKMTRKIVMMLIIIGLTLGFFVSASLAQTGDLPNRVVISGLQGRAQRFNLSCESRSAVDWAAFWGVRIGEKQFLKNLPRSDNPDRGFVGDPDGVWGNIPPLPYGVHAEPVAALLREYGLQADARLGMDWDELRAEIAAGRPVIVWVIGEMWSGSPVKYVASDGRNTKVARFEHTMILYGYDKKKVYVLDAYTGNKQTYPIRTFLNSWKTLGKMAIVSQIYQPSEEGASEQPPAQVESRFYLPSIYNRVFHSEENSSERTSIMVRRRNYLNHRR